MSDSLLDKLSKLDTEKLKICFDFLENLASKGFGFAPNNSRLNPKVNDSHAAIFGDRDYVTAVTDDDIDMSDNNDDTDNNDDDNNDEEENIGDVDISMDESKKKKKIVVSESERKSQKNNDQNDYSLNTKIPNPQQYCFLTPDEYLERVNFITKGVVPQRMKDKPKSSRSRWKTISKTRYVKPFV